MADEKICVALQHAVKAEPLHTHDFIEIVYISKGHGTHSINGKDYAVKRGNLLFINCGQTHSFKTQNGMTFYNLMLRPEFISDELVNADNIYEILSLSAFEEFQSAINRDKPLVEFSGEALPEIESLFASILREHQNHYIAYSTLLHSYITAVLTHIFRKIYTREVNAEKFISPELLAYIENHCEEHLTLNSLAERCFYNPSYLSRMFSELQGKTLTRFIHESRIKKACHLLDTTTLSIDDICLAVGYSDKTMFYRRFREFCQVSPAKYRKK